MDGGSKNRNQTYGRDQMAIKTLVPDEIYTDRKELLDLFYNEALKAATRRTVSMVLLGQRRMGKTEIFKRAVNRLFFEQDYKNPCAVVPAYYKFPDNITVIRRYSILAHWEMSQSQATKYVIKS